MTRFFRPLATLLCSLCLVACATVAPGPTAAPDDPEAGTFTDPHGTITRVRPDELTVTGSGTWQTPDGSRYSGAFVDGKPHGEGTMVHASGSRYTGQWQAGLRHGRGELTMAESGGVYVGDFAGGLRHGKGSFTGPAGTYIGHWFQDQPQGPGRMRYPDGSVYEGFWDQGSRQGQGTYTAVSGSTYRGSWSGNVPHGFGRIEEDNGFVYEGEWLEGRRDGYGSYRDRRGITYDGTWQDGKQHGYGAETRPDGSRYEGDWLDGQRHGQGTATTAAGDRHSGQFVAGRTEGAGQRQFVDGTVIRASWSGDVALDGTLALADGAAFTGPLFSVDDEGSNQGPSAALRAWLAEQAAGGSAWAQNMLANILTRFEQPRPTERITRLRQQAAEQGVPDAQTRLAEQMLAKQQVEPALALLRLAADAGHPAAHLYLGTFLQLGQHLPRDHRQALDHYTLAHAKGSLLAGNNLAWLLATSPDPTVRDGARAVALIEPIASYFPKWEYLDTLAAALAEAGAYERAAEAQQNALEQAADRIDDTIRQGMDDRLALYRQGKPFRDDS